MPRTVPTAPRNLAAAKGVRQIVLSWQAPSHNGGAAIDNYAVQRWNQATSKWVTIRVLTGLRFTDTGLADGTTYKYRVLAHNLAGWGAATTGASQGTATVAGAPTAASATPGDRSVVLHWLPPTNDGGSPVTAYEISEDQTGLTVRVQAPAKTWTTTGLQNGKGYAFRVRAVNAVGVSPEFAFLEVVPATVPGIPLCTATRWDSSSQSVSLPWTVPGSEGGHSITGYHVVLLKFSNNVWSVIYDWTGMPDVSDGKYVWVSPGGMTREHWYSIHVAAVNDMGTGPECFGDNVWAG